MGEKKIALWLLEICRKTVNNHRNFHWDKSGCVFIFCLAKKDHVCSYLEVKWVCGTAGTLLKAWSSKEADWFIIFTFPDSSEEGRDNPGNMPILSLAGRHELALSLLLADQKLCSYVSAVSAWAKILCLSGLLAQLGAESRLNSFSWCQCKQRLLASAQSLGKISLRLLEKEYVAMPNDFRWHMPTPDVTTPCSKSSERTIFYWYVALYWSSALAYFLF